MATSDSDEMLERSTGTDDSQQESSVDVGSIGNSVKSKIMVLLIGASGFLALIVIVAYLILELYGSAMAIVDKVTNWWERVTGQVGEDENFVLADLPDDQYYAKALQQALEEGSSILSDGSDMTGLDDSDLKLILDRVVEQNEKKYETSTVRYEWYQEKYLEVSPESGVYDWKITTPTPIGEVVFSRMDIEGATDSVGNYIYDLHWPTLIVLAGLRSYNNYDNWGNTGESWNNDFTHGGEYGDMDGYYLADDDINGLIDMLNYRFMYYYDGVSDKGHSDDTSCYKYNNLSQHGYKIGYSYAKNEKLPDPYADEEYHIIYEPATAPDMIYNCYESWEYLYETDSETGDMVCVGRIHKRDATKLVAIMEEFFPDIFEVPENYPHDPGDIFFEQLIQGLEIYLLHDDGSLPAEITDEIKQQIAYYQMLWAEYRSIIGGTGLPVYEVETDFYGMGVHYCNGNGGVMSSDDMEHSGDLDFDATTSFQIWVGEYTNPHSGATHTVHNWYNVSTAALADLRVSDNLSKEQIRKVMERFQSRAQNGGYYIPFVDATDALYDWQQSKGYSLLGLLAIIDTEGGYGKNAMKGYNFFNMISYGDDPYFQNVSGGYKWADFKTMTGGDIGAAMVIQLDRMSRNYIENRDQYNYFLFCWLGYLPDGYEPSTADSSKLVHSYCPWYDDTGYITTGYDSSYGWCNKCGVNRLKLETLVNS